MKPGLALGSWAAFSGNDSAAKVMGDLVLLENELGPVVKELRSAGFEITAVHNHLMGETPHVLYVHYMALSRKYPSRFGLVWPSPRHRSISPHRHRRQVKRRHP
jgi:Domain of Unknown Function (DUF1259)